MEYTITPKQTSFLLENWEQLIDMKIVSHNKLNELVEGYLETRYNNLHRDYMEKKKQQLEYYHKKFNGDNEESKTKKKKEQNIIRRNIKIIQKLERNKKLE